MAIVGSGSKCYDVLREWWYMKSDENELEKLRMAEISVRAVSLGFSVQEKCILNPDLKALGKIYMALAKNIVKHGKPYCPCRIRFHPGNVCPCTSVRSDILENGHCKCRLFFAKINIPKEHIVN